MFRPFTKEAQLGKREKESKPMKKVSKKQAKEHVRRRKARKKLIKGTNGICQECGESADFRGLQMHHIQHVSQGGKTAEPNLVMVCAKCHAEFHHIKEL